MPSNHHFGPGAKTRSFFLSGTFGNGADSNGAPSWTSYELVQALLTPKEGKRASKEERFRNTTTVDGYTIYTNFV
jgi:hypothetical protein